MNGRQRAFRFIGRVMLFLNSMVWKTQEEKHISLLIFMKKLSEKSGKIMKDDILITGGGSIGIPYIVPTNDPIYVKDADLLCIQKSDKI